MAKLDLIKPMIIGSPGTARSDSTLSNIACTKKASVNAWFFMAGGFLTVAMIP